LRSPYFVTLSSQRSWRVEGRNGVYAKHGDGRGFVPTDSRTALLAFAVNLEGNTPPKRASGASAKPDGKVG
jgi:hypothetical protein